MYVCTYVYSPNFCNASGFCFALRCAYSPVPNPLPHDRPTNLPTALSVAATVISCSLAKALPVMLREI